MSLLDDYRLDRTKFFVGTLDDADDEKAYWLSRTPLERLRAMEYMRQIAYGYDPATTRIQRVLEIVVYPEDE